MTKTTGKSSKNALGAIIGNQLSGVLFIQDYVQLQFDGPGLTALNWPTVTVGESDYTFGMSDYRNVLCERITKIVRRASVIERQEIRIELEDESSISIALTAPEDSGRSEMAIFDNGDADFWVWNA